MKGLITRFLPLLILLAGSVGYAGEPDRGNNDGGRICFQSRSESGCNTFLLTETGYGYNLSKQWSDIHINWEVGMMHKLGDHWAVGGTVNLIYDAEDDHAYIVAIKPRVRRWLHREIRADFAAGFTISQFSENSPYRLAHPSWTSSLSIGIGDWVAVMLGVEYLRQKPASTYWFDPSQTPPSFSETNWYIGISFGAYPGAILAPIALIPTILAETVFED